MLQLVGEQIERDASFIIHAGDKYINKLKIRALDGLSNFDGYDVYLNGVPAVHYTDVSDSTEFWNTIEVSVPDLTGDINVRFHATDTIWSGCESWGQIAVNWVKAWGYECRWCGDISGHKFNANTKEGVGNWSIYLTTPVSEEIQVPVWNALPTSGPTLESGKQYIVQTRGIYLAGDTIEADAECSITNRIAGDTWTSLVSGYESHGDRLLDLTLGGVGVDNVFWGECNSSHNYSTLVTGQGVPITFQIDDFYASNDSGSLTVQVFEVLYSTQITGDDGSYNFNEVCSTKPLYLFEETREGWVLVSPEGGKYQVPSGENYDFINRQFVCGDGIINQESEECDGEDGVGGKGEFCTSTCKLVPIYDGDHTCSPGTTPIKIGSYNIDSQDADGVSFTVTPGQEYLFKALGIYSYNNRSDDNLADAAYGTKDNWNSARSDIGIWGTNRGVTSIIGDLGKGMGVIEWDDDNSFNQDHVYQKAYTPTTDTARFLISDWYDSWYSNCSNQGCLGDNEGSLNLDVYECVPSATVTVCKYDSQEKPLSGWKMVLKGKEVDRVEVYPSNANGSTGGTTNLSVESDTLPLGDYVLEANGYYTYRGTSGAEYTDAIYSKRDPNDAVYGGPYIPWVSVMNFYHPHTGWLGVMVNGTDPTNWSDYYNPNHKYALGYLDHSGKFGFTILDNYYGDNSGSIPVDIYEGYAGITGDNGCITFKDVPYGEYTLEEIMKDGWGNVSGLGSVEVNDATETFTIVNRELLGDLRVCKFEDMYANGYDNSDSFISWNITLNSVSEDSDVLGTGTWEDDGCYHWYNLPIGNYLVTEEEMSGWYSTTGDREKEVAITDGETQEVYFGNFKEGKIKVCKYDDYNGDGKKDSGEPGIEGVSIALEGKTYVFPTDLTKSFNGMSSWKELKSEETSGDGCVTFSGLEYGMYRVKEDLNDLPGYLPTDSFDIEGDYVVSDEMIVTSGYEGKVNFFDKLQPIELSVVKDNDGPNVTPGSVMGYTLTVTNDSESTAYDVLAIDNMPYGFTYVSGSTLVNGIAHQDPSISGGQLSWTIGEIPAGESVVITYSLLTPTTDLGNGFLWNLAYASGYNRPAGSGDSKKSESNVAASDVAHKVVFTYSTGVGGAVLGAKIPSVLGASTELPATGSQTIILGVLLMLLLLGIAMKFMDSSYKRKILSFAKGVKGRVGKIFSVFFITMVLSFFMAGGARATINDIVYIQDLPTYFNTSDFTIAYTAVSDNPVSAKFFIRKDGDSTWKEIGTASGVSGQTRVEGGDVYDGDGKYFFKVEINSGSASDETFTTIDRSAPDPVRDYRKEKKGDGWYKLFWKNPDNEDYDKVIIYRSDEKNFTADSGTEIATMWGSKGSDMTMENSAASGKEYYFALRAVDKAGNVSGIVADPETTETVYEEGEAITPNPVVGEGEVKILPKEEKKGEVLGEKEESSENVEVSPAPSESPKPGVLKEAIQFTKDRTKITVGIIAVLLFAGYFGYKKLLRKKN